MRPRECQGLAQLLDRHPPAEVGARPGDHRYEELAGDVFRTPHLGTRESARQEANPAISDVWAIQIAAHRKGQIARGWPNRTAECPLIGQRESSKNSTEK